jgi:hypothetical protein
MDTTTSQPVCIIVVVAVAGIAEHKIKEDCIEKQKPAKPTEGVVVESESSTHTHNKQLRMLANVFP